MVFYGTENLKIEISKKKKNIRIKKAMQLLCNNAFSIFLLNSESLDERKTINRLYKTKFQDSSVKYLVIDVIMSEREQSKLADCISKVDIYLFIYYSV